MIKSDPILFVTSFPPGFYPSYPTFCKLTPSGWGGSLVLNLTLWNDNKISPGASEPPVSWIFFFFFFDLEMPPSFGLCSFWHVNAWGDDSWNFLEYWGLWNLLQAPNFWPPPRGKKSCIGLAQRVVSWIHGYILFSWYEKTEIFWGKGKQIFSTFLSYAFSCISRLDFFLQEHQEIKGNFISHSI